MNPTYRSSRFLVRGLKVEVSRNNIEDALNILNVCLGILMLHPKDIC